MCPVCIYHNLTWLTLFVVKGLMGHCMCKGRQFSRERCWESVLVPIEPDADLVVGMLALDIAPQYWLAGARWIKG